MPETEDNGKVAHVEGRAVWIAGREGGADLRGCLSAYDFCPFCPYRVISYNSMILPGYAWENLAVRQCTRGTALRNAGLEHCFPNTGSGPICGPQRDFYGSLD